MLRLFGNLAKKRRQSKKQRRTNSGLDYGPLEGRHLLTTFVINSLNDNAQPIADGELGLREAMIAANTNAAYGDAEAGMAAGDIIQFPASFSGFTTNLTAGQITISDDVIIQGGGHTINGGGLSRLFQITTGERVGFGRLTFTGGMATEGAAIHSVAAGTKFAFESTFTGNIGTGLGGGAIYHGIGAFYLTDSTLNNNQATGAAGRGGAVQSLSGNMIVDGGSMTNNSATLSGGAVEIVNTANFQTFDWTASQNSAGVNGGAIHISGTTATVISGGTISQNTAAQEGGGLWNGSGGDLWVRLSAVVDSNTASGASADNGGGGIFNNGGELFVNNSTVSNNQANGSLGSGGGIFTNGGRVLLNGSTVSGNAAARAGGGIESAAASDDPTMPSFVSLDASMVTSNNAGITITGNPGNGGGIHTTGDNNQISMINASVVNLNQALDDGGGIWNDLGSLVFIRGESRVTGNKTDALTAGGLGGGIYTRGYVQIVESFVNQNQAVLHGGGIYITATGDNRVIRSNFAANSANRGGAIYNQGRFNATGDPARKTNITSNVASVTNGGGGIFRDVDTGSVTLLNADVFFNNNTGGDIVPPL